MSSIQSLNLTNFRSYDSAGIDGLPCGPVVLYGANGAGKTNVLEAVSFLTPGRGLRSISVSEAQRKFPHPDPLPEGRGRSGAENPSPFREREGPAQREGEGAWAVAAVVETAYGQTKIGTGLDAQSGKRIVRINGETAKAQADLSEYLSCVWLTPQMDRLFIDAASTRRRFLDRLVFAFDPGHAGRVTRYENAMSQRAKILKEHEYPDPHWLDGLEGIMAETGVAVAAARRDLVARLQQVCDRVGADTDFFFPRAKFYIAGTVEELLANAPALEVEDMLRYQLRQTRAQDKQKGSTATGPHRSDLSVRYAAKDMPAAQCSTGEQKALLIGIILAHAQLIAAERGSPPILLLDEVAAHLDEDRRTALYNLLLAMKGQVWLTGTDAALFRALEGRGVFFEVRDSVIRSASARTRAA